MAVHDMRSPLTVILMHSSLLALGAKNMTESERQSLEAIHTQTNRLNAFANELLLLGKMESGQLLAQRQAVSVSELLQPLQEQYTLLAQSSEVQLQVQEGQNAHPVLLDSGLFIRVIDNLLANALKVSSSGETVSLQIEYPEAATPDAPQLRIRIADEGPGVPPEHQETIFDKFRTVKIKKEGIAQTGLGLAFCRMSVQAHDGRIYVTDNQPKGAVFVVEI
jgi:two-component system, sensor histidine kinase and response regulator